MHSMSDDRKQNSTKFNVVILLQPKKVLNALNESLSNDHMTRRVYI